MSLIEAIKKTMSVDTDINDNSGEKMNWRSSTMVFIGMWFSMWAVTVGFTLGQVMSPIRAILACVVGFLCTGIYQALVGVIGCKEGKATVSLLEKFGGKAITVIFAISTVIIYCWSVGMQADIAGQALGSALGLAKHSWCSVLVCAIMGVSAFLGIKAISKLSNITVPIFLILTIIGAIIAVRQFGGLQGALNVNIENTMSFGAAVTSAAGAWISFATMGPDVCRHIKTPKDVVISSVLSMVIGVILPVIGVILAITTKVSDMGLTFTAIGMPWIGFLCVFFAAWTTNDNNGYCGGIALAKLTKISRPKATLIVLVVGIILAGLGSGASNVISASLGWLSSMASPVGGLLIGYYYIVAKNGKQEVSLRPWVGLITVLGGFLLALLGEGAILACIPVPSFILGIASGAVLEVIFANIDMAMTNKKA